MAAPIPDEAPVTRATVMSIPNCSADTSLHGVTTWYLTAGDLIALHGHLYLPANGQWADVPALPVPKADPVLVGGDRTVLACWGYDVSASSYGTDCYQLQPTGR